MSSRKILIATGISGVMAVALGAFGAHALQPLLQETARTDTYQTAVNYHFYHTLLLGALALAHNHLAPRFRNLAVAFVSAGLIIFCGSLYVLCFTGITWLGAVTPVGGLCFIAGWLTLAVGAWKHK